MSENPPAALEKIFTFGPGNGLVGIVTEPDPARASADRPAVLIWNVGINHRVGPFRISVDLARRLAQQGFTVLRFDISGMGDSEVRKDTLNEFERAALDVREAMDALQSRRGINRFVLVGFCSSVDAAHVVAVEDERVAGVAYLEAYVWRTGGYYLRYPLRLLSTARWHRLLALRFPNFFGMPELRESQEQVYVRDRPSVAKFRRDVRELVFRGVKLLFVYVGGDNPFTHRGQFFEMVGGNDLEGKVQVEFYKDADHTFYLLRDRARLLDQVCTWARTSFGEAQAERQRSSG
jgi:pimeloyl-ACP methyl ester carboxylesterase